MNNLNCLKEFLKYSFLNVFGMIGLSCYILADTFFVSNGLGINGLTALNLAIPIYSFIHGSGLMLGMGGATKYSIYKSGGASKNANLVFTNTVYLTLFLALIFMLIGLFLSQPITTLLGANTDVFWMTNTYLQVILLFSPAFMLNDIFICFVRNDGNPRLAMLAMLTGSFVNILLDYVFIFPLQMGILGAVLATGLAPLFSMLILSQHVRKRKNNFHFIRSKPSLIRTQSTLSLGFPSLITEVSSGIVMIVFNMIILKLQGNTGVAAYGIIANLSLVVTAVFTGIAHGIQPLLSKAHGCHNFLHMKLISRYAMTAMLLISIAIYLSIFLCSDSITFAFNRENNMYLQNIAIKGLKLYFTSIPFIGFNIILSVLFTSKERAVPAHIISLLRGFLLLVPMSFLFSERFGITGVWLSLPITELSVSMLGAGMYYIMRHSASNDKC